MSHEMLRNKNEKMVKLSLFPSLRFRQTATICTEIILGQTVPSDCELQSLCAVPGNAADNDAAGAAGAGIFATIPRLQAALHQHPHALLLHQHRHRPVLYHRPPAAAWRGGICQGQVSGN